LFLAKQNEDNQIKQDEKRRHVTFIKTMTDTTGRRGGGEFWPEKLNDHLEYLDSDGTIILKCALVGKKKGVLY
jgi:hypothetical protein